MEKKIKRYLITNLIILVFISWNSELGSHNSGHSFLDREPLEIAASLPQPQISHPEHFSISDMVDGNYSLPKKTNSHTDQPATKKASNDTAAEHIREVTAYNVGDPNQNYGDPCISANGENICVALEKGLSRCAANFVPFGTQLFIEKFGTCTVTDRMNRRYKSRVDIAMKLNEKRAALKFGVQRLKVQIIKLN